MSIQTPSAFNPADRIKVWFNNLLFSTVPRRLSFSPDFTITEDPTNNFFNISLVAGGAGSTGTWDPNLAEVITHKTITDATNIFPSNFAKTNAANIWTLAQNFPTSSQVNSDNIVTLIATQILKNKDLSDASNIYPTSLATLIGAQALTHKDLTDATNTFPSSLATLTTAQTLTHKNLTDATNTFPASHVLNTTNNNLGAFYEDLQGISSPAAPNLLTVRVYMDSTNGHLTVKTSGGTAFDTCTPAVTNLVGTLTSAQIPASVVYNNQNNAFGAFYEDVGEIAQPSSPAAGTRRLYVDSTTHALTSLDSGGVTHNLEVSGGATFTKGKATFSGTGSLRTFNIAHSIGSTPSSISVTPGSLDASKGYYNNTGSSDNEGANVWYTADATNIIVNYNSSVTAPASGTNNLVYWWVAYA